MLVVASYPFASGLPHRHRMISMLTSSNGNIFRVTGPLCGEFAGHRWFPRTWASDAESCFLWSAPWINVWVNNHETSSHPLWLHCNARLTQRQWSNQEKYGYIDYTNPPRTHNVTKISTPEKNKLKIVRVQKTRVSAVNVNSTDRNKTAYYSHYKSGVSIVTYWIITSWEVGFLLCKYYLASGSTSSVVSGIKGKELLWWGYQMKIDEICCRTW